MLMLIHLTRKVTNHHPQNLNFLMGDLDPIKYTIFWLTPLTTPNGRSIASHGFTELCHTFSIYYNGSPIMHLQNCPFHGGIRAPFNTCFFSWTYPTHYPKWQLSQSFFQNTCSFPTDQQTDRPTE